MYTDLHYMCCVDLKYITDLEFELSDSTWHKPFKYDSNYLKLF